MKRYEQGHTTVLMPEAWTEPRDGYVPGGVPQQSRPAVQKEGAMIYVGTLQRPAFGENSNTEPGFFRADWGSDDAGSVQRFIAGHPHEDFYKDALASL